MQREGDHATDAHFLAWLFDAPAVDADMPFLEDVLCEGAALQEPDEEEEAIDPHFFLSFTSSAKA